jgi:acyl-CoA synthetase (AMP-forming)/AMP-acid ligase II
MRRAMQDEEGEGPADFWSELIQAREGAVVDASGHHGIAALQRWAENAADALTRAGLTPAEPVLVPASNEARDLAAIFAVVLAGGVAVPVHRRAHAETLAQILAATGARFRLTTGERPELAASGPAPAPRPLLDGAAMITFTSGSTGRPKGVVLARRRIAAKLRAIQQVLEMPRGAVTLSPLQLIFSFGQWVAFLTLARGGTVHLADRFDPRAIAETLARGGVDYLAAVPTMLRLLLDEQRCLHALTVLTGGEPATSDLRRKLLARWPATRIASIYGLTETGTCDLFQIDAPGSEAPESMGHPSPSVEVATDPVTGELMIRTPFAMLGYLDMPDETARTLAGGWLRTGDVARIEPYGSVTLVGRLKELINRGGNKISPLEVERLFAAHPDVQSALATGVRDERLGEAVHLLIVPRVGGALDEGVLKGWARGRIERFKLPDRIHFGQELPLGSTGKADRGQLRRLLESGGG